MTAIITTIAVRPYVFLFLAAFLVLGRIYWGWKKTFIWLVIGYVVAWGSEYSSIHNGFPYGLYHYRYENMAGELMIFGVPFWDSLSYPFMIFAGWTTARFILKFPSSQVPKFSSSMGIKNLPACKLVNLKTAILGAFLTMLLDVIIDPLTVRGDRWFLGDIYYYPNGGEYFGVPLTNFAGWFFVPLVVIIIFQPVDKLASWQVGKFKSTGLVTCKLKNLSTFLNPLFYLSIAAFNIIITIWIGEPLIASIDCLLLTPVVWLLIRRTKKLTIELSNHRTIEPTKA